MTSNPIKDRGVCPCGHTVTLLEGRIAEAQEEITRLEEVATHIGRERKAVTVLFGTGAACPAGRPPGHPQERFRKAWNYGVIERRALVHAGGEQGLLPGRR